MSIYARISYKMAVKSKYRFGMVMKERQYMSPDYRYGFNGMEKDDEVKGDGNSYDFGARIYDSRLGRWLSLDHLQQDYPELSPYQFVANNPIRYIDPDGRKIKPSAEFNNSRYGTVFKIIQDNRESLPTFDKYLKSFDKSIEDGGKDLSLGYAPGYEFNSYSTAAATDGAGDYFGINTNKDRMKRAIGFHDEVYLEYKVLTDVNLAGTLIHELIHTHLKQRNPNLSDQEEHEIMATRYRDDIVNGIAEFSKKVGIKLQTGDAEALSWVGLEVTNAIRETFNTESKYGDWLKKVKRINEYGASNYYEQLKMQILH